MISCFRPTRPRSRPDPDPPVGRSLPATLGRVRASRVLAMAAALNWSERAVRCTRPRPRPPPTQVQLWWKCQGAPAGHDDRRRSPGALRWARPRATRIMGVAARPIGPGRAVNTEGQGQRTLAAPPQPTAGNAPTRASSSILRLHPAPLLSVRQAGERARPGIRMLRVLKNDASPMSPLPWCHGGAH